jgi:hypothetical protein
VFFGFREIGAFSFVSVGGVYIFFIFFIAVIIVFGAFWISQG